jgi:dihydropteroate synthase
VEAVHHRHTFRLKLRSRTLVLGERTLVMGVLNVTPDSFSDGGLYLDAGAAVKRALEIEAAGADILDIGGESTRPGSEGVSAETELGRVLPVMDGLRGRLKIPISIDTQKARVAEAALAAGVEMVNDVSALRSPEASGRTLGEVVRRAGVPLVLMHMRGRPKTMQQRPFARDVMRDVTRGLGEALERARRAGIPRNRVILDPGIGFGKSVEQNCELLARLAELARLGCPLVVGASRKTFLGALLGGATEDRRIWGTAASVTAAVLGGAHIVRVHDVREMVQVVRVADRILKAGR